MFDCITSAPIAAAGVGPAVAGEPQQPADAGLGITYDLCVVLSTKPQNRAKNTAQIVRRFALQDMIKELLPDTRIKICKRYRVPESKIKIFSPLSGGKSFYAGLMSCGLGWLCPICGAKIAERRKQELIKVCTGYPFSMQFGTFTLQHRFEDDLETSVNRLMDAYRSVTAGEAWQDIKDRFGLLGAVKYLEIRYGRNGWHPHLHVIYFYSRLLEPGEACDMENAVKAIYRRKLKKLGGYANDKNGFQMEQVATTAEKIAEYICKWDHMPFANPWGIESELVLSNFKKTRGESLSFFELVELATAGTPWAKKLVQEYARVTKGLRMISWSRGLRDKLLLPVDLTDQELAEQETSQAAEVAEISQLWPVVLKYKLRGLWLNLADSNPEELQEQIEIAKGLLTA